MATAQRRGRRGNQEGSIWQSGKSWVAQIRLGGRRVGKRFGTRAEAQTWLLEQRQGWREARQSSSRQLIRDYAEDWLSRQATSAKRRGTGTRSPRTVAEYGKKLRSYVVPQLGAMGLAEVTPPMVAEMLDYWRGRGVGARTMRHTHTILKALFGDAVRRQEIQFNPAAAVDPPGIPEAEAYRAVALSLEQWAVVVKMGIGSASPALVLAAAMGLRRSEVCGLTWDHVHLDKAVPALEVAQGLHRITGQGLTLLPPKNRMSERILPLPALVTEVLRSAPHRSDFVCTTSGGRPLDPETFSRSIWPVRDLVHEPELRLHHLRHTIVTLVQARTSVPFGLQQAYWGHAQIGTTLGKYFHPGGEDLGQVSRAIDNLYAASSPGSR